MTNEELKAEMKVLVDVEGVLKAAKVIDATTLKVGNQVTITGWVVHIEPSGLPHTTTADKIHPRTRPPQSSLVTPDSEPCAGEDSKPRPQKL